MKFYLMFDKNEKTVYMLDNSGKAAFINSRAYKDAFDCVNDEKFANELGQQIVTKNFKNRAIAELWFRKNYPYYD